MFRPPHTPWRIGALELTMVTLRQAFVESGYVVVRQACTPTQVAALRAEVDAARGELEKGGYRIWATAETLPPTLREWSETHGLALARQVLPAEDRGLKCIGGAAILKLPGRHDGTPFHQDDAYGNDGPHRPGRRACAMWIALSDTDARSGAMRFAPSLGFELLPHDIVPRESAPSGFERFLTPGTPAERAAERVAESVPMRPGDVLAIGSRVVHGSHAASDAERMAFSPLYEWD